MNLTPDTIVYWQAGPIALNATLVFTWVVIALMATGSWLVTRRLSTGTTLSRGQNLLEVLVTGISDQIESIAPRDSSRFLPFVGTLFLFIAVSNLCSIIPGFHAPTGSLSTTAALALCVFVAVPIYGVAERGLGGYLTSYFRPNVFILPFIVIGEISRTFALAIRLFGNVMSGTMIATILLAVAPLFFPILISALGLLTGMIHAYIFAVLSFVYIASAMQADTPGSAAPAESQPHKNGVAPNG